MVVGSVIYFRKRVIVLTRNARWSEEEVDILKQYYSVESVEQLMKRLPGRKASAIYVKGWKLGMTRDYGLYTPEEITTIMTNLGCQDIKEIAQKLPGRTYESVRAKMHSMGVTTGARRRWTPEEDRIILDNPDKSCAEIVTIMQGGRSESAVRMRRNHLKYCMSDGSNSSLEG